MAHQYRADMTAIEVRAALTPWLEAVANHSCLEVEARLDAAILAAHDLAREVAHLTGENVWLRARLLAEEGRTRQLRAALAQARAGVPRTKLERMVDVLSRVYGDDCS
jgi:hypothetical protein